MPSPLDVLPPLAPPGRYRIERELGSGGMAVVYLAHDLKHDRPVAIKVVRREIAFGLGPDRFLREIQIAARLQHPLILGVIDSGQTDEPSPRPYYVMPYVEGETLRERLVRDGPLTVEAAVALVREVGEALVYAHQEGVVHRDVKPENVMLSRGHALVADFGIARAARVAGDPRLTETGSSLGTPSYMSPEQAGGDSEVDARSDQYSLSCVLYELLSGQPPFMGATAAAVMAAKLTQQAIPVVTQRPGLPPMIAAAVDRALARAATDRFESVADFLAALGTLRKDSGPPENSLVVLPFTNLSQDPDNEYFGDGLTEELIADLSKVRELRVIARNSAMRLKGTTKDARTLGRELNVRYVLGGSVRRAGESLRITAQLSDAADDRQVWAEKYSGTMSDVFELQERISRQIVAALKVTLTVAEQGALAERPIKNPRAYDLYLRARQEWDKQTKPSVDRAVRYLKQAEEIEGPNLRLIWSLAIVYWLYHEFGWETALDLSALREDCVARARDLGPHSAEADLAEALVDFSRFNFVPATYRVRRVLEATPTNTDALFILVQILAGNLGQPERARPAVARFRELDPLSYGSNVSVGVTELMAGRYSDALAGFEAGLESEPGSFDLRIFQAWAMAVCGSTTRAAELYRALAEEASAAGPGVADWCRVCACGAEGNAAGLLASVTPALRAFLTANNPLWVVPLIGSHAMVGLRDEAMDWLEQLFTKGFVDYPHLTRDPLLANLRGFPRFEQFLPVARAKWEAVARQLEDLPPLA